MTMKTEVMDWMLPCTPPLPNSLSEQGRPDDSSLLLFPGFCDVLIDGGDSFLNSGSKKAQRLLSVSTVKFD